MPGQSANGLGSVTAWTSTFYGRLYDPVVTKTISNNTLTVTVNETFRTENAAGQASSPVNYQPTYRVLYKKTVSSGGTLLGANEYLAWTSPFRSTGYWKGTYTDGVAFSVGEYSFSVLMANVENKTTMTYSDNQGTDRGAVFGMKSDGTITFLGPARSYSANQQYTFNISQYDYVLAGVGYGYAGLTVSFS